MDIPALIRSLGAQGLSADDIADAVAALLGPTPLYHLNQGSEKDAERRRKNAERMAAYRERKRAERCAHVAEPCASVAATTECDVAVTVADCNEHTSRTRDPAPTRVVVSSLPSEEVIIPPQEPLVLSPPNPESRKRKRTGRPKSRRCPDDWEPNDEHRKLALDLGLPSERARQALAKFRDHEFSRPYSDWDATFRNWLRKDAERTTNGAALQRPGASFDRQSSNLESMARGASEALARRRGRWGFGSPDFDQSDAETAG